MAERTTTTQPKAQSYIIKRPRLTKLLDESGARIILLCAPAGYGKTTLAREWTSARVEPVAWYTGGIEMLDAAALAAGLGRSFRNIGLSNDAYQRILALASHSPTGAVLGGALSEVLLQGMDALLVIDDYHHADASAESASLIAALAQSYNLRLLMTSRVRPSWFTSRMSVYGEALCISTDQLAFTDDEARAVLGNQPRVQEAGIVVGARGWPAVIGLATMRGDAAPAIAEPLLPADLYEYFAEDLFRHAPHELRTSLFMLALGADAHPLARRQLLGSRMEADLVSAADLGFITQHHTDELEIHPLLREFLLAKLHELEPSEAEQIVDRTLQHLALQGLWDECLEALVRFPTRTLIVSLLGKALPELLESGRVVTIKRWLDLAFSTGATGPLLLMAEAEIALREGDDTRAQVLAERAGNLLKTGDIAAQAHVIAARAAHLRGDGVATHRNSRKAQELASDSQTRVDARWLEFLNAVEMEDPGARRILKELERLEDDTPEHAVRIINARAFLSFEADGDAQAAARHLELGYGLLQHVSDPLIRTTLLNLFSISTLYLAEYERSLSLIGEQLDDARQNGLGFAADHGLTTQAGALTGLRKLAAAHQVIQELESKADSASNFIIGQTRLKVARMKVATGDLGRAEIVLRQAPPADLSRAFHGEWFGTRALVLAAMGKGAQAARAIRSARQASHYVDARHLAELALAVTQLNEHVDKNTRSRVIAALSEVIRDGHLDAVVLACRAYPTIVCVGATDTGLAQELTGVLTSSRDIDIGRAAGLEMPREFRRNDGLSPREREVYELLIQGRTNGDIAKTLFISESTAKVHVRHIYEKLGVHTRAEAATVNIEKGRT